jgi:uncharacterized protein
MPRLHRSVPQGEVPRFVPDQPLPPYSFVPGRFPHPVSDPQGHSFGADPPPAELLDPDRWQICRAYLYGVDLFNHGYYWEAHESWEGLWLGCVRTGRTGWFLKGLIKLAAAGVKARAQNPRGMQRHARRAAELFRQTAQELGAEDIRFMGLPLTELIGFAGEIANRTITVDTSNQHSVEVVFNFILHPGSQMMDSQVDNSGKIRVDNQEFCWILRPIRGNMVLLVSKSEREQQLEAFFDDPNSSVGDDQSISPGRCITLSQIENVIRGALQIGWCKDLKHRHTLRLNGDEFSPESVKRST